MTIQMKYLSAAFVISVVFLSSCGGSLSDEQRRRIKEGMEDQKITKVSDAEISAEAITKGQRIYAELQKVNFRPVSVDSLADRHQVTITFIAPGQTNARALEQDLIEAYINAIITGGTKDNLQKVWTSEKKDDYDSLLYTNPQIEVKEDGVEELRGIWNIYLARKNVVREISRRK
jgi:hypothetical protein